MGHSNILKPHNIALIIIDFQDVFRKTISEFEDVAKRIVNIARGFKTLDLPIIVTEQYPKGLGRTAREILDILPSNCRIIEKSAFSSCGEIKFLDELEAKNVKQVLLCGLETHICVNQSAHDLLNKGFEVHVLEDAVGSRTSANKVIGIEKMRISGTIPSCLEMALFELLGNSKHEHFKKLQNLIK